MDNSKILKTDSGSGIDNYTKEDKNQTDKLNNCSINNPNAVDVIDENFYHRYIRLITGIVTRILTFESNSSSKQDIEDCINEIFAVLLSKTDRYVPERGTIEAYISVVSRSVTLNFRKKLFKLRQVIEIETRTLQAESSWNDNITEREIPDKSDDYNMLVSTEAIRETLKALTQDEKILFTLKYIYYYKASEIAKYCGISVAAAEKRSTRLRKKLQKLFKIGGLDC